MSGQNIIISTAGGRLLKYDSNGNLIWKKALTRTASGTDIDWNDNIATVSIMP